jgi:hypothetical protein
MADNTKIRSVLKKTEELVTQSRLNQIAKEHRSIGSILDDRQIFALEVHRIKIYHSIIESFIYPTIGPQLEISEEKWQG